LNVKQKLYLRIILLLSLRVKRLWKSRSIRQS